MTTPARTPDTPPSQEITRLQSRLHWYETHDRLTGLMNLTTFLETTEQALLGDHSKCAEPAIFYFNIRGFSSFNKRYGFAEGDRLLQAFANEMCQIFDTRLATRFASDMFYICADYEGFEQKFGALKCAVTDMQRDCRISLHAGIYLLKDGGNPADLPSVADYHAEEGQEASVSALRLATDFAKIAGDHIRTQDAEGWRIYDQRMDEDLRRQQYIVEHLDEALQNGNIMVYFQPVIRSMTGELCGAEALARWKDPIYKLMPPGAFIDTLEQARLIHKLDIHILRESCRIVRERMDRKLPVVPFSFNLSRQDFELCDIFAEVNRAVEDYEIPKDYVNIEITERMFQSNPEEIQTWIDRFHEDGFEVWMDDFGSEYSSLNILRNVDFNEIKIDMGFLRDFSPRSRSIITSMVDMGKKLGIHTLTEGVETREQFEFLRNIGCEKVQGYYFSKPLPTEELLDVLAKKHIGIEEPSLRYYYDQVGAVNLLGVSELMSRKLFPSGSITTENESTFPLALIESVGGQYRYVHANEAFRRVLDSAGTYSIEDAEEHLNAKKLSLGPIFHNFVQGLREKGGIRHMNYVKDDNYCIMTGTVVASADNLGGRDERFMLAVTIQNLSENIALYRGQQMDNTLRALYTMYDEVFVSSPAHDTARRLFADKGQISGDDEPLRENLRNFAQTRVYPEDRERYHAFANADTMVRRIRDSGKNFISDYFRVKAADGSYVWKLHMNILVPDREEDKVLTCVQLAFPDEKQLDELVAALSEGRGGFAGPRDAVLQNASAEDLSDGDLWKSMVMNTSIIGFWKDDRRRFLGVTRAFLDYYGLSSQKDVVGKTDEEMHWHVDPAPFREEEERVLRDGEHILGEPGHCVIRGQQRDILAFKEPIYKNGRIVGLMGSAIDVTERNRETKNGKCLALTDSLTGLGNTQALMICASDYLESYQRNGIDFLTYYLNVTGFRRLVRIYGEETGRHILCAVGQAIMQTLGSAAVVGRVAGDQFIALEQLSAPDPDPAAKVRKLEQAIRHIRTIDAQPVTLYVRCGWATRSQSHTIENMLHTAIDMANGKMQ